MKSILALLFIIGGVFLGLYVGLWWAFIGGIVDLIHQCHNPDVNALHIAYDVVRILFANLIGFGSAGICIFIGFAISK